MVFIIVTDNRGMTGLTIDEMCEALNLPFKTVEARIQRAGIKPITRQALYPPDTLEAIRNVPGKGRPPKAKSEPPVKKGKQ